MILEAVDERETYTMDRLVGSKTGLVKRVGFSVRSRDAGDLVIAKLVPRHDAEEFELAEIPSDFAAVGKGRTQTEALHSVVGEYVERYCAFTGLETDTWRGTYAEATDQGFTTPDFALLRHYRDRQYDGAVATPFDRETPVNWARGTDLVSGRSVALPLWLASSRGGRVHGFASSNGCAAGQRLAGAVYRGLLETIERDALMRCWYERTRPDRISLEDFPDLRERHVRSEPAGGEIELLDLGSDLPFATVGAAFVGTDGRRPAFFLAGAARLRFEDAVADALDEIGQLIRAYRRVTLVGEETVDDPGALGIGDNGLYYAEPENFGTVERLVSGPVLDPDPPGRSVPPGVSDRLEIALDALDAASMEAVVYDVTNPEIRDAGLCATKVVVPQLAPLCDPEKPAAGHPRLPEDAYECDPHPVP